MSLLQPNERQSLAHLPQSLDHTALMRTPDEHAPLAYVYVAEHHDNTLTDIDNSLILSAETIKFLYDSFKAQGVYDS